MSIERGKEYYDNCYSDKESGYYKHYSESVYFELWGKVLSLIPDLPLPMFLNLFEIGCGTGQFARMLLDNRSQISYSGIDFSENAIKQAKETNPGVYNIKCANAYDVEIENDCIVICLETFEHLNDFKIIERIPLGVTLIFTIPDFNDPAHVRYFKNITEIVFRYYQKINFTHIEKFQSWFVCQGTTI